MSASQRPSSQARTRGSRATGESPRARWHLTTDPPRGIRQVLLLNGTVASAYALVGVLAKLLTIPPDTVPLWPSAGIALVATLRGGVRLLPGVLLGALLAQAGAFFAADTAPIASALQRAGAAASGAALAALVGALLVRRFVSSLSLQTPGDIARFLFLSGPAACLVSASAATAALLIPGAPQSSGPWFGWFAQWASESLGVAVTTPILLVWFGEPRRIWLPRQRRVAMPLLLALVVSVAAFSLSRALERGRVDQGFQKECSRVVWALENSSRVYTDALQALERLIASNEQVNDGEFGTFVEPWLADYPEIQAIEWIPRVTQDQREDYESGRLWSHDRVEIREQSATGLVRAGSRAEYYPVAYVYPRAGNVQAVGFDLASNPERRQALDRARDTGQVAGTAPVRLAQEVGSQNGMLVVHPHYGAEGTPFGLTERRERLRGFTLCVLRTGDFVASALSGLPSEVVDLHIVDRDSGWPVIAHRGGDAGSAGAGLHQTISFDSLGRSWALHFTALPEFVSANRPLYAWRVFTGCLLFTALLGAFLLILDGHITIVEDRVSERTEQLNLVVEELRRARRTSEAANEVKSRFIASVSHEIRTPLTAILGFGENLKDGDLSDSERADAVSSIVTSGRHLHELINDILDLSKIEAGKLTTEQVDVDIMNLIGRLGTLLAGKIREKRIDYRVAYLTRMPRTVSTDPTRIRQILLNLLGNAIKFSPVKSAVVLQVALVQQDSRGGRRSLLEFSVRDSGIGMSSDQISRLFQPFTQADETTTRRFGGTGLGLAITKQLCEILGGRIDVTSEVGRGSTFRVSMPVGRIDAADLMTPGSEARRARTATPVTARMLVVAEGAALQDLVCAVFERVGAEVTFAGRHDSALDLMREATERDEPFELLLTDVEVSAPGDGEGPRMLCASGHDLGPGFWVAREFCGRAGGKIEECDEADDGNCFRISIPTRNAERDLPLFEDDLAPRPATAPTVAEDAPLKARILVAEDGPTNQKLIRFILERAGAEVTMVGDGQQALDLVRQSTESNTPYDLLLTDIQMPELDGYQLVRTLRAEGYDLPIIALTANAMDEDRHECFDAGCNAHAPKPIHRQHLVRAIRQQLTGRADREDSPETHATR